MADPVILLGFASAGLAVAGLVGLVWSRQLVWFRQGQVPAQPEEEPLEVVTDWRSTGKIDFGCSDPLTSPDMPAVLVLRSEEYRVLESISGTRRVELRWRNATIPEAKHLASRHNAAVPELAGLNGGQRLPVLLDAPAIAVEEPAHADKAAPALNVIPVRPAAALK